jgi:hypothetical protein
MPNYTVKKEIWIGGLKKLVGEVVTLAEAQVKYLAHALEKVEAKVEAKVAAKAAPAAAKAAPAAGAVVTEAKPNGAGN